MGGLLLEHKFKIISLRDMVAHKICVLKYIGPCGWAHINSVKKLHFRMRWHIYKGSALIRSAMVILLFNSGVRIKTSC